MAKFVPDLKDVTSERLFGQGSGVYLDPFLDIFEMRGGVEAYSLWEPSPRAMGRKKASNKSAGASFAFGSGNMDGIQAIYVLVLLLLIRHAVRNTSRGG